MQYIDIPNLPRHPVHTVVIDGRAGRKIEEKLISLGISVIRTQRHAGVHDAISLHPDIMLHHIGGKRMVYAPGTSSGMLVQLASIGFELIQGISVPGPAYPQDIAYNVARVGNFAFHNLKYTDPVLRKQLKHAGVELVHVNQGYTKCSVSVVDERTVITSDPGITKAVESKGIEAFFTDTGDDILLPGLSCGFLGGSTGLLDRDLWALAGSAGSLKSFRKISEFLEKKKFRIIPLSDEKVMDIGSILPLLTK